MQQNPNLFVGLGPFAGLTQAGSQLATKGIQSLFNIKDPELERTRILKQTNTEDPASLRAAAQALMAQGDIELGMQLAAQARQLTQQERQFGLQERGVQLQEATSQRAEKAALQTRIKEAPYAAIGEVTALPDSKEKEALLVQISNNISKSNLDTAVKEQQLTNLASTIAKANGYSSTIYKDANNNPLFTKGGEGGYWYYDEQEGKMKRASSKGIQTIKPPTPSPYDFLRGAVPSNAGSGNKQPPLAAAGPPQGQAGGSLADIQARARAALEQKQK